MSNCRHLSQLSLVCFSRERIQCKNKKNLSFVLRVLCIAHDRMGPSVYVLLNMTPLENFRDNVAKYKTTYQNQGHSHFIGLHVTMPWNRFWVDVGI